jgi:formate/nitrite transporter FocA (FNT family)
MFSWLMNFVGALFVAYFIAYLGEWTDKSPVKDYVIHNSDKKCALSFVTAVLRGVGKQGPWGQCKCNLQA